MNSNCAQRVSPNPNPNHFHRAMAILYSPFDLSPPMRRVTQSEILVAIGREIRVSFNKIHDKVREVKTLHMDKIADAHSRMREVADELPTLDGEEMNLSHLVDPQ